jgi:hypothetical protein
VEPGLRCFDRSIPEDKQGFINISSDTYTQIHHVDLIVGVFKYRFIIYELKQEKVLASASSVSLVCI